jgi:hypothetical protein
MLPVQMKGLIALIARVVHVQLAIVLLAVIQKVNRGIIAVFQ